MWGTKNMALPPDKWFILCIRCIHELELLILFNKWLYQYCIVKPLDEQCQLNALPYLFSIFWGGKYEVNSKLLQRTNFYWHKKSHALVSASSFKYTKDLNQTFYSLLLWLILSEHYTKDPVILFLFPSLQYYYTILYHSVRSL